MAVIAAPVDGLDLADDEAGADRAVAAADDGAAVADARHGADAAVAAGRQGADGGLADHAELAVHAAGEPEPGRVPRDGGDRPVGQRVARLERERGLAARGSRAARARRRHRRCRRRSRRRRRARPRRRARARGSARRGQRGRARLAGDVPRDQRAVLAAGEQELVARERERGDGGAGVELPSRWPCRRTGRPGRRARARPRRASRRPATATISRPAAIASSRSSQHTGGRELTLRPPRCRRPRAPRRGARATR